MARLAFSGLILFLTLAAPAAADLTDARFRITAEASEIWLGFDHQPELVEVTPNSAGGLDLVLQGVEVSERRIVPRDRNLVQEVWITNSDRGPVVRIFGAVDWSRAETQLRQGGVLITLPTGALRIAPAPAAPPETPSTRPDAVSATAPAEPVSPPDFTQAADDIAAIETPVNAPPARTPIQPDPEPQADMSRPPPPASAAPASAVDLAAQAAAAAEAEARRIEAEQAEEAARVAAAETSCERAAAAVEESPWDESLQAEHAGCLAGAGDLEGAARIYELMLAFEPENASAALALAEIRAAQGDRAAARRLFEQAASNAISDAEAARAMARARELAGQ